MIDDWIEAVEALPKHRRGRKLQLWNHLGDPHGNMINQIVATDSGWVEDDPADPESHTVVVIRDEHWWRDVPSQETSEPLGHTEYAPVVTVTHRDGDDEAVQRASTDAVSHREPPIQCIAGPNMFRVDVIVCGGDSINQVIKEASQIQFGFGTIKSIEVVEL